MRVLLLASALISLPVADDSGAEHSSTTTSAKEKDKEKATDAGISRVSEPGFTKGNRGAAAAPPPLDPKKQKTQDKANRKVVNEARSEAAEMLEEVRGVISNMEKGTPIVPDVTVLPPEKKEASCDLELPQVLAFELQRIRAVRDEAMLMLDLHDKNLAEIDTKLQELQTARQQLDKSRAALEETLARKSTVDDEKEKERRRLRLLMSSRQMKPKKIAALMEEISIEEARVLLEALPEVAAKGVLEALPPERLAQIVGQKKPPRPEATTSSAKPKETL